MHRRKKQKDKERHAAKYSHGTKAKLFGDMQHTDEHSICVLLNIPPLQKNDHHISRDVSIYTSTCTIQIRVRWKQQMNKQNS